VTAADAVEVRTVSPAERALRLRVRALGVRLFAPFGDYAAAMDTWIREPGIDLQVALRRNELAGFSMVALVEREGVADAYLVAIGVDESARRSGVAAALLRASLSAVGAVSSRYHVAAVTCTVAADNEAARALFAGAGFTDDGAAEPYPNGRAALRLRCSIP
jgi:ribosomal protein S18 acetylase RimI-like enzyme